MASGSRERAERALQQIETIVPGGGWFFTAGDKAVCSGMIRGWLAQARGRPAAPALARRLDSLLATDPPTVWPAEAGLVCARLLESAGDTAGALRAIRRSALSFEYRTTFLREEGRLASLTGDTAGAARAYRRYLAFRWAPEPVLQPEAARIREELARLQLGSGRTRN